MAEQKLQNRERIVEAANRLFYLQGYNQTSFADLADELGISKGNLHYHFRSKEDLLDAIIALRLASIKATLATWDEEYPDGLAKLKRFVQMLRNEEGNLVRYGCPLGSLNMELGKDQRVLQKRSRAMFDVFGRWLEKAFRQLGCRDSKTLSMHLLTMAQGAALMSSVYADAGLLRAECQKIDEWLDSL